MRQLLARVSEAAPGGWFGLLGIVLLIVLVVIAVRRRTGSLDRGSAPDLLLLGGLRTAAEHRAEAEPFAGAGAYAEAVRSRLRAIVG